MIYLDFLYFYLDYIPLHLFLLFLLSPKYEISPLVGEYLIFHWKAFTMNQNNQIEPLLNKEDVARILGVSVKYVYHLTHTGKIPYIKWGRYLRFRKSDIEQWLMENTVAQTEIHVPTP